MTLYLNTNLAPHLLLLGPVVCYHNRYHDVQYRLQGQQLYAVGLINEKKNMLSFSVYKGAADGTPVKSTTSKPKELVGDQVLLKVLASGVCGTGAFLQSRRLSIITS